MTMPLNNLRVAATAGVMALALAGCGSAATSKGAGSDGAGSKAGGTLAFATVSQRIAVISALGSDVTKYMKSQGVKVIVQDGNFDPSQQAQQLTTAINNGQIKAAWIFPVAPEALKPIIQLAQSKKIPIVVEGGPKDFGYDGPQPGVVFDAASFTDYGAKIATEAADCVNKAGGSAKVAFLEAPSVAGGAKAVHDAITSTFADKAPDAEIVANAHAADPQAAQTQMTQLLQAHPDITAVIAGSDETALGAVGAFAAAGKTPQCIVAGGGSPDVLKAQKDGKLTAVVAWDYGAAVDRAGAELTKLMSDPTATGQVFSTPINVIK
jgi:ABC-type sugar transport system substrate-binding protein